MSEFLLVHGSCHGAWCWERLVPELRALGHTVRAIDLPGHGEDPTPVAEVTAAGYRGAILAAIEEMGGGPVILAGHSMAGFPISDAAEAAPHRIARLIYVCAYVPRDGASLVQMRRESPRQPLMEAIEVSPDRQSWLPKADKAREVFYQDCPEGTLEAALPRLRPQAIAPQATPIALGRNFAGVPKSYIRCTRDNTIPPEHQAAMVAGWPPQDVHEMTTGHSPFYADPRKLALLLDRIARG